MKKYFFSIVIIIAFVIGIIQPGYAFQNRNNNDRPNILFVIADDWSWPHAGAYGDKIVKTPAFDKVAQQGILFNNAFCVVPSCTPSRATLLTGKTVHSLGESGNLWSILPQELKTYVDLLQENGYFVGFTGKGWGPGSVEASERKDNPAGPSYHTAKQSTNEAMSNINYAENFKIFLNDRPKEKPFCFWYGSSEPHRNYKEGTGAGSGIEVENITVPGFLPDVQVVKNDIADYYYEIEHLDKHLGLMLEMLEKSGAIENTLIVVTSDNGMPFPRAKANLNEYGVHMPLAMMWKSKIKPGREDNSLISFLDFAPTFLDVANIKIPKDMQGRSLLPLLEGKKVKEPQEIYLERERHACVRENNIGYPARAIRTRDYLFIWNIHPERWPAGDPEHICQVGPYGDIDASPTKAYMMENKNDPKVSKLFELAFQKRPREELYKLSDDPYQLNNLADDQEYGKTKEELKTRLIQWMKKTDDPRAKGEEGPWDKAPYRTDVTLLEK